MRDDLRELVASAFRKGDGVRVLHTDTLARGTCADCERTYHARRDLMLEVAGKFHLVEHCLCDECLADHRDTLDRQVEEVENEVAWAEHDATDAQFHRESWKGAL